MRINKYWVKKRHNKTYRGSLTKYQERKRIELILAIICSVFIGAIYNLATMTNSMNINGAIVQAPAPVEPVRAVVVETITDSAGIVREVTAYNAGDPYQTDSTPCISASGDNICNLLAQGQIIFASNEFPIGTKLYVEGIGEGTVLDRMNRRYKTRIDVAMQAHEKPRAIAFGLQNLEIKIVE